MIQLSQFDGADISQKMAFAHFDILYLVRKDSSIVKL